MTEGEGTLSLEGTESQSVEQQTENQSGGEVRVGGGDSSQRRVLGPGNSGVWAPQFSSYSAIRWALCSPRQLKHPRASQTCQSVIVKGPQGHHGKFQRPG